MAQFTDIHICVLYGNQIGQFRGLRAESPHYAITSLHTAPDQVLWVSIPHGLVALDGQTVIAEYTTTSPQVVSFLDTLWCADASDARNLSVYDAGKWLSRQSAVLSPPLQRISNRLRPADLTPRPPLQMGAGERNCRRVQPF